MCCPTVPRPGTHPARQDSPAARSLQTQRAVHLVLPPAGRDRGPLPDSLVCPGKRERTARWPHALASTLQLVVQFSLSQGYATPSRGLLGQTNHRGPYNTPCKDCDRSEKQEGSSTALDSAMVIARRIAASVALSSKRRIAPSDWTPSFAQRWRGPHALPCLS